MHSLSQRWVKKTTVDDLSADDLSVDDLSVDYLSVDYLSVGDLSVGDLSEALVPLGQKRVMAHTNCSLPYRLSEKFPRKVGAMECSGHVLVVFYKPRNAT